VFSVVKIFYSWKKSHFVPDDLMREARKRGLPSFNSVSGLTSDLNAEFPTFHEEQRCPFSTTSL
jgi:hypothetical protein